LPKPFLAKTDLETGSTQQRCFLGYSSPVDPLVVLAIGHGLFCHEASGLNRFLTKPLSEFLNAATRNQPQ